MTEVPDYVPQLIAGLSGHPKEGGCVVQIANWLYDPTLWTDEPTCVYHQLSEPAITINDLVDDEHRRQLALLAPRLSGTHLYVGDAHTMGDVDQMVVDWKRENPAPYKMGPAIRRVVRTPDGEEWIFAPPRYQLTGSQQEAIDWLSALIDEFDRITGRNSEPLPIEKWDRVRELLGQK